MTGDNNNWFKSLRELAARLESLGVGADIASLSIVELCAVYRFLVRVAGE